MSSVFLFRRSCAVAMGEERVRACSSFALLSAKRNDNLDKFSLNIQSCLISSYSRPVGKHGLDSGLDWTLDWTLD